MYLKVITMRIKDIADALHLSVSTVSKALNGGFDVSPETKEQVLKYAKENGYKSRDERLKVKSIRRLCVLFDNAVDSKSNIFIPLSLAFAEAARVNNFETITRPISDVTPSYEKFMVNNNYDGAFIVGLNYTSPFFKELETTKIPTVLYDNILNGEKVSTITNDNINTIQRLVTLLAKSGHKKIGFIHADKQSFVANERYAGYIIGLMMNNIDYNPDYVFYGSFSEASGFEASEYFAQRDVTAVVCSSDIIAVGFINGI
jgi:LacI family transcriptional regulator